MMNTDNFNAESFLYIIKSCAEGIKQFNNSISTEACAVINQICTTVFKETEKGVNPNTKPHILVQFLNQYPQTLSYLLHNMLDVVIFEDCPNNWSYSRPLLGLILLAKDVINIYNIFYSIIIYNMSNIKDIFLNNLYLIIIIIIIKY